MSTRKQRWLELGFVVLLFLAALFIRTYQLHSFPPGLYNDEAAYGMDGLAALHGDTRVFYERNNGREPLFIYLLALAFQFLGPTSYAIRVTAAVVGALTIPATYWMTRAIYRFAPEDNQQGARWYAAWVALFLTFSYWHISLSRVGFRAITLPLVMAVAAALFWITWRHLRAAGDVPWLPALLGGLALGGTLYTYTAGRMSLALFAATVAATWLLARRFGIDRTRLLKTAGVMVAAALLAALPLLTFFAANPAYFGEHAAEVSVLNPKYAGDNPAAALLNSAARSFLLFVNTPDGNLRHNPAQIPVFDPLMAAWLVLGIGLSIVFWRRLTTLFALLWFLALAVPAILSSEGVPHSLRMIGMLPIVYVLPVVAMGWVTGLAPARLARPARWLPLPFLIIAATVALTSYFGAWSQPERFRAPFRTDYADFARSIAAGDASQTLWVMPLFTGDALADGAFNTIDFFQRDPGAYTTLTLDESTAPAELDRLTQDRTTVNVLRPTDLPELYETSWIFADVKGLLKMLLRRNSVGEPETGLRQAGMPYVSYQLLESRDFELPATERAIEGVTFGDTFRLTGANLGGGNRWTLQDGTVTMPADQPIWAVLRWEALQPLDSPRKSSLVLRDEQGAVAAQADDLLAGDRFPDQLGWNAGEHGSTYHVVELPPGLLPGRYTLSLRVYDEESGRVYPAQEAGLPESGEYVLATIAVEPPLAPAAELQAQHALDTAAMPADFQVIGYDLPVASGAPGDSLPLVLTVRSPITPATDYAVQVDLLGQDGIVAASTVITPGAPTYPPSVWRAGESFRIPASLATDPSLPGGTYTLAASILAAGRAPVRVELASIEIGGRPRLLEAPAVVLPAAARFGDSVRLVGVNAPETLIAEPGATVAVELVWQPLRSESRNLVRFAQLLDGGGALVAQQDTIPCSGECPATSWLDGEYLLDGVTLLMPDTLPAGDYRLITGWYDAETQVRLDAVDGDGAPLAENVVELLLRVSVSR